MTVHKGCGGPVIWCRDDTGLCTRCHAHGLTPAETEQVPHPADREPTNFELIEQGLLRLDPETREHVIAAMLVIQRYRGDRSVIVRILAPRPGLPPSRLISSCI